MDKVTYMIILIISIGLLSCSHSENKTNSNLNKSEERAIFPKGDKIESDNFEGTAWLLSLVESDSTNHTAVGSVTFEPGARTNWHLHPDGQIILAIEGVGYYQELGSPKIIIRKGDVVSCPPDIPHWHGASADKAFVQIAITSRLKGPTVWMNPVTDEEYLIGDV